MGRYDGILIASDFDHTLTDPYGAVPEQNCEAICAFMAEGGRFTVASGRSVQLYRSRHVLFPSNAPAILFNGALCYDFAAGKAVFGDALPPIDALIPELLRRYPFPNCEVQTIEAHSIVRIEQTRVDMFHRLGVVCTDRPYNKLTEPIYLLFLGATFVPPEAEGNGFQSGTPEMDAMFEDCIAWLEQQGPFTAVRSTRRITEVMARGVSKGAAARRLANLLGCSTLVCVGDAMNDLSMLQEADRAFTPSDGDRALVETLGGKAEVVAPCGAGSIADVITRL